ncbi:MAG TPA: helix-hairpin-helix domain-containing protein [Woeseiaceae bacterium]|nr:helix-hairpin-helix domain-containing protein [Woeseiaceae bacterium]
MALHAEAGSRSDQVAEEAAMEAVCGACHTLELVTTRIRSKQAWFGIFEQMLNLGAQGTDKQFAAVGRYILTRLTQVRVNEAPADELALLLDIPGSVAAAIVSYRERQKIVDLEDLRSVPGIDADELASWADRIVF